MLRLEPGRAWGVLERHPEFDMLRHYGSYAYTRIRNDHYRSGAYASTDASTDASADHTTGYASTAA